MDTPHDSTADPRRPYAVLVAPPQPPKAAAPTAEHPAVEALVVFAASPKQAFRVASQVCVERGQPTARMLAVFTADEWAAVSKLLARAAVIGPGHGHVPGKSAPSMDGTVG